jgi:phytoene/squalene synthetase
MSDAVLNTATAYRLLGLHRRLPKVYLLELLGGFQIDIDIEKEDKDGQVLPGKDLEDVNEFIAYAEGVAGSVGAMLHYLVKTSTSRFEGLLTGTNLIGQEHGYTAKGEEEVILHSARDLGVYLQFVNNARDIIDDSRELGRCYAPTSFFAPANPRGPPSKFKSLLISPPQGFERDDDAQIYLRELALLFLRSGDHYHKKAFPWLDSLPMGVRRQMRTLYEIRADCARVIRERKAYPNKRAEVGTWRKLWIGMKTLYLT